MKDDRVYLEHIHDALGDIATYTAAGREVFLAERMRQDATLRKLEVIGQAVKNLSEGTKSRQPQIPWKQIAGMRDKVSHDYFGVKSGRSSKRNRRNSRRPSRCCSRPRETAGAGGRVIRVSARFGTRRPATFASPA